MSDKLIFAMSRQDAYYFKARLRKRIDVIGSLNQEYGVKTLQPVIEVKEALRMLKVPHTYLAVCSEETKEAMQTMGVKKDQIVNVNKFKDTYYDNPMDGLTDHYDGLLMGMSHSQCAINTSSFSGINYFKMSAPSMDMFLHYHFLKNLTLNHRDLLSNMKSLLIELPYYIFNYDLSLFGDFVFTKMKYFDIAGNWHHLSGRDDIREYRLFARLFDKPVSIQSNQQSFIKNISKKIGLYEIRNCFRAITNKDKVWTRYYEETKNENAYYWNEFKELVKIYMPHANLTVLVMPMNIAFRKTHSKSIMFQKSLFYSQMGGVCLVDDFELFNNPCLFSDHCHCNCSVNPVIAI